MDINQFENTFQSFKIQYLKTIEENNSLINELKKNNNELIEKVKIQQNELINYSNKETEYLIKIKELEENAKVDKKSYSKISFISNIEKQLEEKKNTIQILEKRLAFYTNKSKSTNAIENIVETPKVIIKEELVNNQNFIENVPIVEEKQIIEQIPIVEEKQVLETTPVKKTTKRVVKKKKEDNEQKEPQQVIEIVKVEEPQQVIEVDKVEEPQQVIEIVKVIVELPKVEKKKKIVKGVKINPSLYEKIELTFNGLPKDFYMNKKTKYIFHMISETMIGSQYGYLDDENHFIKEK